jgi:hypothetical protein
MWPRSASTVETTRRTSSPGRAWTNGIPPAREITSGRAATANSARTSEADIPRVRPANDEASMGERGMVAS